MDIETVVQQLSTAPGPSVDFNGTWINQIGSKMVLSTNGSMLVGTYTTASGANAGTPVPLFGTASSDILAFTVNWSAIVGYNGITAWVGQMVKATDGRDSIKTLWQLTSDIPDAKETTGLWTSVLCGADDFFRE